ncbi:flagellar hook-length control protein FliK [Salipiger bermudensis]|uniref:flagellar hook-length control protein FliK n=1 Tax=Salipiger bermudensis TaxID=344736 RepID=UPI001CD29434|nr:flagellar hook-length control protein FliK [Salipiger bermudensis]MCA0964138.1 flagellar hook-length control protein FliK [Salipiger bermudensis]
MKFLSLFGTMPEPAKGADGAARTGEGDGAFASIMAFLRSDEGIAPAQEGADLPAILSEAEEALADPDLTDDELEDILAPMLEDLATALAAVPARMEQLRTALSEAGIEPAPAEPGSLDALSLRAEAVATGAAVPLAGLRPEPAAPDASWRTLAEAMPLLRAALKEAPVTPSALTREVASEPGVQALVGRVLGLAEEIAQPVRRAQLSELAVTRLPDAEPAPDGAAFERAETPVGMTQRAAQPQVVPVVQAAGPVTPEAPQTGQQIQVAVVAPMAGTSEAAPVLQTEAPRPVQTPAAPSSDQILTQVRAQVSETGRIRVELKPEGMGTLEIDLAPDESGALKVTVRAEQASVLTALRSDRDGLVALLREAGHQVDDRSLSFSDLGARQSGQGASHGQSQGQGAPGARGFGLTAEAAGAEPEVEMKQIVLPLAGGVDIQV